jgi:hypothetical protein
MERSSILVLAEGYGPFKRQYPRDYLIIRLMSQQTNINLELAPGEGFEPLLQTKGFILYD